MEYSRVRAIAYPTKGSDCNNEPYYLSFIQTTDRMGAKEKNRTKQEQVFIGDSLIHQYCFKKNYYFVSGDNMANSQDSRYWGMLPEEYIVGKATRIWNSKEKYTDQIRWERILMQIK